MGPMEERQNRCLSGRVDESESFKALPNAAAALPLRPDRASYVMSLGASALGGDRDLARRNVREEANSYARLWRGNAPVPARCRSLHS